MIDDNMTTTATAEQAAEEQASAVVEEPTVDSGVATSSEAAMATPMEADAPAATETHGEPAPPFTPEAATAAAPLDGPQPAGAGPEPVAVAEATPEAAPETSVEPAQEVRQETAPEQAAPAQPMAAQSDAELFEAAMASLEGDDPKRETQSGISRGDRIEAKVIQVEKDKVFVDLGTKAEAILPLSELTDDRAETAIGLVQPGDTFEVIVLKTASAEGAAIVSKRKADFDHTWQRVLDAFEEGKVYDAQVLDRVKGGLVVDIGVRGFVPATHVGNGKLRNIEKYVGQTLAVKIIEVDRERKKVVLSNKAAEGERKEEVKKEIFENVKTGDVLPGVVRRLTDYGAFVDLGGIDGLLHISEMSWYRIDHPKEVLREGDEINVQVLRLDSNTGRVSLGLRQVLPDPWSIIKHTYQQGQKIKCTVGRIVQSGAFVRLPEGAEAFLPLSECSNKRVKKPNEVLEEGQEIEPTIIDLRPDDRRMVLSLRDGAQPGTDYSYDRGGKRRPGAGKRPMRQDTSFDAPAATMRAPSGGATIGERLGMLKGMLRPDPEEPAAEAAPVPAEEAKD